MTSDDRIVDYLRARGRERPPAEFVSSVMRAIDATPAPRSWFSAYVPAFVAAGALTVFALLALLIGPGRDVGPAPTGSDAAAPTFTPATLADLETAVRAATERLAEAPAVEGLHTHTVEGYLASATWFDWRPSGDAVVVTRSDLDVSAPWWTDPEGEPLSVGERVDTDIWVVIGDTAYAAREDTWLSLSRGDAPDVLHWGTGMLSGAIPPVGGIDEGSEPEVTRRALADGGAVWRVEVTDADGPGVAEWHIGPEGRLTAYLVEGTGVTFEPTFNLSTASTRTLIEFAPVDEPGPIQAPDPDATPDPSLFGLPPDFPLGADQTGAIDSLA